ncbi:MAG TPA: alpha/beta fold hydrolase, partial [Burkholderiales bacterium]|nr:alpha/beta fold hydrolase [Burkholderiales bacterium]
MKLHVESEGNGRDVVLLHGWGMHGGYWKDVSEKLSERFRVHLVDLPGHGFSGYREGDWVEMLAEAVPFEISLCGWSLGGQLAMEWAFRYPGRVKKLALVSTTPCFVSKEDWIHGISEELFEGFLKGIEKDAEATLKRFL